MSNSYLRIAVFSALTVSLAGCSYFRNLNAEKERLSEEEKAGRIEMVLGDQSLEASADLAGTAITLPAAETLASWPQAGSGPTKTAGHVAAAADLSVAWRVNAGKGSTRKSALTTPPVASEQYIFVVDSEQTVRAFDLETGRKIWQRELKSGNRRDKVGIGAGMAYENGRLVVASGYGFVTALNAGDGSEIWRRDMEAPMTGAPTIKDGRAFVSSNNNEIFALDLDDGQIDWTDQAIAESARVLGSSSPAAVEDIVIAPYSSGEIIAYLAANGRRLWTEALSRPGRFTPISSINDIASRPVIGGGLVFAANQSGVMAAIDGRTGSRLWVQPIGSTSAPSLVGPYLFVSGTDGKVAAIAAESGKVYWVKQLRQYAKKKKKKGRIAYAGPIVASDQVLVVSSRGELIALSPQTGEQTGSIDLKDPVYLEPISVGDKVFVLTDDARLIAIR
ncbi:outer membrane protein assembly factor BamB family protein [Henriciella litoralis]|uniref:outer membrane protein assembly factor BamB family protein n=1 Tax=Henriciella litoralis TaxID=568102 RepID=UPI0009FFC85F|nr:PQQ-like beta-propeller repeat protein [Henriciella litoralis]